MSIEAANATYWAFLKRIACWRAVLSEDRSAIDAVSQVSFVFLLDGLLLSLSLPEDIGLLGRQVISFCSRRFGVVAGGAML